MTAMAKEKEKKQPPVAEEEAKAPQSPDPEEEAPPGGETPPAEEPDALAQQEEKYLRLCAEYDNYRKRTTREKEAAWATSRGETVKALLGVYDDVERASRQETADEAFKKGVQMILDNFKKALAGLGVEEIAALGQPFDANLHSAVMHVDDPALGENTVKEVFQTGFKMGENVIRYAVVVVAN